MVGFCFVLVLFMRKYTLKRATIRGGKKVDAKGKSGSANELNDVETGLKKDEQTEDAEDEKRAHDDGDKEPGRSGVDSVETERELGEEQGDTSATNTVVDSHHPAQRV